MNRASVRTVAATTHITIPNPDDVTDSPIFDGPLCDTTDQLVPGIYDGETLDGDSIRIYVAVNVATATYA